MNQSYTYTYIYEINNELMRKLPHEYNTFTYTLPTRVFEQYFIITNKQT